jgi:glycosyltransferase involved in cell wall biosynthesis
MHLTPVIAVLRGLPSSKHYIGYSDIEVWSELAKRGYFIHIFLQGRGNIRKRSGKLFIWEIGFPGIPILSACIYCLVSLLKLIKIKPYILVVYHYSFPTGAIYKFLKSSTLIALDIRSIPVGPRIWIHKALLKRALCSRFIDVISVIRREMLMQIIREYNVRPQVPIIAWTSGFNPKYFNEKIQGTHIRSKYGLGKQFIIIYHGSITRERGLETLINAFKILSDEGIKNVGLWILGEGKDKDMLKHLALQLGLQESIQFFDSVPYSKVAQFIAAADAGISPLPANPWWLYQFPLKIVECLAVGKPVIATDIMCHRLIGGGIIFAHGDTAQALSETIKKFISLNKTELEELKKEALKAAEKYTWEKQALLIDKFLKNLLLSKHQSDDAKHKKLGGKKIGR